MAYPKQRSWRTAMLLGTTDGTYKAFVMNRGGSELDEDHLAQARQQMSGVWHGFREAPSRIDPTGRVFVSPYYKDVAPADGVNV